MALFQTLHRHCMAEELKLNKFCVRLSKNKSRVMAKKAVLTLDSIKLMTQKRFHGSFSNFAEAWYACQSETALILKQTAPKLKLWHIMTAKKQGHLRLLV